jgi:hypothetical protein
VGDSERELRVERSRRAQLLKESQFARYTFLGDYEAIASFSDGYIEAAIERLDYAPLTTISRVLQRLRDPSAGGSNRSFSGAGGQNPVQASGDAATALGDSEVADIPADRNHQAGFRVIAAPDKPWQLEVSPMTPDLQELCSDRERFQRRPGLPTLKIREIPIDTHERALEVLEAIAGSFFFELDLRFGIPMGLQRSQEARLRPRPKASGDLEPMQFPRTRYGKEPLTLYWYARSARGMPLLQYLAYYQILEYYFPVYSRQEALTRLRQQLRDPRFSIDDDAQLGRVLALAARSGRGFGSEREQLKATIRACMDPGWLREFFSQSDDFKKHFGRIAKVALGDPKADLRDEVANRIYDLRCRIVHTKDEGADQQEGLLLPFSREAKSLTHDVELVKWIAQKVLIAGATTLTP